MSPALLEFYSAATALCFVLLGFWWAVVQLRYDAVMRHRSRRRMAYVISLHFAVLGLMSLVALLTEDGTLALWRVTFGLGGVIGVVASGFVLLDRLQTGQRGELAYLGHFLVGPLYAVVAWFALVPELADRGFGVPPLVVEAVVIALILLVDVHLAWSFFAAARLDPAAPAGQSPSPPQPGYPGPPEPPPGPPDRPAGQTSGHRH